MNNIPVNCIIVHGCPSDSSEEKTKEYAKHCMPWIRKELTSKRIKTEIPLMPEPWHPDYKAFKTEFEKYADNEEENGKKSLSIFHKALGGKIIELKGMGHFCFEDMETYEFPELLKEIIYEQNHLS